MPVDVPRDRNSEAYARIAAREAAYEAHRASVEASRWRCALHHGQWRVTRTRREGGWTVLDHTLDPGDPEGERGRLVGWLRDDVLHVKALWLWPDRQVPHAFDIQITR